jgi:hypothetical protein
VSHELIRRATLKHCALHVIEYTAAVRITVTGRLTLTLVLSFLTFTINL